MATLVRTYRLYFNADGTLNVTRVTVKNKTIMSEALVTTLAAMWADADVGTAVAGDLTTLPIAADNTDTGVGGPGGVV